MLLHTTGYHSINFDPCKVKPRLFLIFFNRLWWKTRLFLAENLTNLFRCGIVWVYSEILKGEIKNHARPFV